MSDPIEYLNANATGVWTLLGILVVVVFLGHWITWLGGWGRFRGYDRAEVDNRALRYVFSEATVKIIDDFRHLLALILVLIFAAALAFAMGVADTLAEMRESIQVIAASLGGLVGSIIGYYFGESSAVASLPQSPSGANGGSPGNDDGDPPVQGTPPPMSDDEAVDEVMGIEGGPDVGADPGAEPPTIVRAPTPKIL